MMPAVLFKPCFVANVFCSRDGACSFHWNRSLKDIVFTLFHFVAFRLKRRRVFLLAALSHVLAPCAHASPSRLLMDAVQCPCNGCHAMPCCAIPFYAMPRDACYVMLLLCTLCYTMLCYAMPCKAVPCYAMVGYAMLSVRETFVICKA
jgi:hypothetical protein